MYKRQVLLSLLISSMELFAQEVIELKGCVYDEQKAPVPGAAVYLKDRPGVGVSTNIDGEFAIKTTIGDILVVSFIGYKTVSYTHLFLGRNQRKRDS